MITEDYVNFNIAKLLKEKEFDGICHKYYWGYKPGMEFLTSGSYNSEYDYPAPTLQMAMKWLRKVHYLYINTFITYKDGIPYYQWSIDNLKTQDTISETPCYNAYEKACDAAIQYCLENLI